MRIVRYSYPSYRNLSPVIGGYNRTPWAGLENEIDRLFQSTVADVGTRFPVDLYEDKANAYVRAELPGVTRADIGVELAEGELTITAARKTPATEGQAEQTFNYRRVLTVPEDVQADQISAAYENGVLTVTLPKRAETQPKKITVAVK